MDIQLNTDKSIAGNDALSQMTNASIEKELAHFSSQITRIEVHLSDMNGNKKAPGDKRCLLEARLENRQPIAVSSYGDTVETAIKSGIEKLKSAIDSIAGKAAAR